MFHVKHQLDLSDLGNFFNTQGITFTREQSSKFELYINLIKNWASRINLISKNDLDALVERHILPSALLLKYVQPDQHDCILDIGSGAGFPGIVFKILKSDIDITLIDSAKKKYLFLLEVNESLMLNCKVLHRRVETLGEESGLKYNIIISRAVADLEVLWNWSVDILKDQGLLYTIKGETDIEGINKLTGRNMRIQIFKPDINWIEFSNYLLNKFIVKVER